MVARFQEDDDVKVFLLTGKTMGTGVTLTAADRVVIVEPNWNPIVDNQVTWACSCLLTGLNWL